MTRRRWALSALGAAAGVAGLGTALWRQQSVRQAPPASDPLWSLTFPRVGGGDLRLADLRGRPILLNFWATWCPPCIAELPLLDRFQREERARAWQVVGLAVDSAESVQRFLVQHPVQFAIGLAGLDGIQLSRTLGNAAGALPFSIVFGSNGIETDRKLGAVKPEDLARWAATTQ